MIKHNIFIIDFNQLYEILDEIKDNLPFSIEYYENTNQFLEKTDLLSKKSLIITKLNKIPTYNKVLSDKNFLNTSLFPVSINKLVELINIQLIKLKFNHQSKIIIKEYELNLNSKFFSKENLSLKLTEKEIEIILYLNETKTEHNVVDLQKQIWDYSLDMETHTVETHIYRLRKKIFQSFGDENFIVSKKNGYQIK